MTPRVSSDAGMSAGARAAMVNRTHRVVRERARSLKASRSEVRSLLLPMLLCSSLMILLLGALWMVLDADDLVASELPPSAHHFLLMLVWFVPVSGALMAIVWFRCRSQAAADGEVAE